MTDVILLCGDEAYLWPEAPPTFRSTRGRLVIEWQRQGLRHVDELGHRYYEYDVIRAERG